MFSLKTMAACVACLCSATAMAEVLPEFDGGDVVVTASGVPQTRGEAPVSVTVVTAQDIADSSARTVPEVLAQSSGINVFNMGGATPAFDLHGFGITGISNTLVLIDGVRQNTNDQAPALLSMIPLEQIERIEIVRGSGAVQYGSGATGGVINIITRRPSPGEHAGSLTETLGSYALRQTDARFALAGERFSLDGYGQSMNTHHYRQNNAERMDGGGLGFNWDTGDGRMRLYVRSSSDMTRLPGARQINPVTGLNEYQQDPSGSSHLNDRYTIRLGEVGLSGDQRLGAGRLYYQLAARDKKTDGVSYDASYASWWFDHRTVDENSGSLRYVLPLPGDNRFTLGADWLYGQADDSSSSTSASSTRLYSWSKQRQQALFAEANLGLWQGARLTVGGRVQRVNDHVQCVGSGCYTYSTDTTLHAWQIGLRQALTSGWSAFFNHAQSFRLPNSDDMVSASGALQPQLSHDQQLGVEWSRAVSSLRADVFRSDVSNEIAYLPFAGLYGSNLNLPRTRHQGFEFEGRTRLPWQLGLHGSLTWQRAEFRNGTYGGVDVTGKQIPMVPQWMANLGLSWDAREATRLSLDVSYVGSQRLDNDQSNQYPAKLSAYTLVNVKLAQQFTRRLSGTVSVNNLFDRRYATYGIKSNYSSSYSVYPGDPRNYQASLTLSF